MVGKKIISRIMENWLGEYILNISEEDIKLSLVRGKLKLDNAQLDGDLIGSLLLSHILSAVGLSKFGVLSCTAKHLRATIPWGKLEKEPTRFELSGLVLVCVPLLPSNANRLFGTGSTSNFSDGGVHSSSSSNSSQQQQQQKRQGNKKNGIGSSSSSSSQSQEQQQHIHKATSFHSKSDPRCKLRTRAKRAALSRFERNFMSGRIAGEGPPGPANPEPPPNQDKKKSKNTNAASSASASSSASVNGGRNNRDSDSVYSENISNEFYGNDADSSVGSFANFDDRNSTANSPYQSKDTNEDSANNNNNNPQQQQNNWRRKLVMKLFRNLDIRIRDIHLRCEVGEGAMDVKGQMNTNIDTNAKKAGNKENLNEKSKSKKRDVLDDDKPPEKRSFAFGFSIDSITYKSANSKWHTGSNIDWKIDKVNSPSSSRNRGTSSGDSVSGASTSTASNADFSPKSSAASTSEATKNSNNTIEDEKRYKILQAKNLSMYWDDEPPVLVSECRILNSTNHRLPSSKVLTRIRLALENMRKYGNPGDDILDLLEARDVQSYTKSGMNRSGPSHEHSYCLSPTDLEIRLTYSNIDLPGPTVCSTQMVPCDFNFQLQPHQIQQYRTLRHATIAQQRLDTMLHQRPLGTPSQDPRAWWKYAISCVVTRPTSRPWRDVRKIIKRRRRYIELVVIKNENVRKSAGATGAGGGFHAGLTDKESIELLALEDFLPIEALLAFHLVALRKVWDAEKAALEERTQKKSRQRTSGRSMDASSRSRRRSLSTNRQRRSPSKQRRNYEDNDSVAMSHVSSRSGASSHHISSPRNRRNRSLSAQRRNNNSMNDNDSVSMSQENSPTSQSQEVDLSLFEGRKSAEPETTSPSKIMIPRSPHSPRRRTRRRTSQSPGLDPSPKDTSPSSGSSPRVMRKRDENSSRDSSLKSISTALFKNRALLRESSSRDNDQSMHAQDQPSSVNDTKLNNKTEKLDLFLEKNKKQKKNKGNNTDNSNTVAAREDDIVPTHLLFYIELASFTVILVDKEFNAPVIQANFQASGWGENKGDGTKLLFDVKNLEVKDCTHSLVKILSFENALPRQHSKKSHRSKKSEEVESFQEKMLTECISFNGEIPLPSQGVVCRFLVHTSIYGNSLNIAAHAATIVWDRACMRAVVDCFRFGRSSERRSVLRSQLRNAATPFAHRAQLALTSPRSFSFSLNIDAPKLWFPVSSNISDGALFIDAGKLKMSWTKPKKVTSSTWIADSTDIQVKYSQRVSELFEPCKDIKQSFDFDGNDIPVILPLDIHFELFRTGEGPRSVVINDTTESVNSYKRLGKMSSQMKVGLSKVSLNLVDVEALAKAIGKWYASQVLHVKERSEEEVKKRVDKREKQKSQQNIGTSTISIFVESIEMILEGQEELAVDNDEIIQLSASDGKLCRRTYMIQFLNISLSRTVKESRKNSTLEVDKVRVVQMKYDRNHKANIQPSEQIWHEILGCSKEYTSKPISATLIQDETNHFNDVEIDLNHLNIRINPQSLSDCSKGTIRVLELFELMTKEMERRVHISSRSARIRDFKKFNREHRNFTFGESQSELSLTRTETFKDSSLLVKINLKEVSIFAAFPVSQHVASNEIQSANIIKDNVVILSSNALIMFQSIENMDRSGSKTIHCSIDNLCSFIDSDFESLPVKVTPFFGPIAAEFRRVASTVDSGTITAQDLSFDCDQIKACFTPNDLGALMFTAKSIMSQIRPILARRSGENVQKMGPLPSLAQYRKKGAAVAAQVRFELQSFSVIVLCNQDMKTRTRPLFDFSGELRAKLEGCASALIGDGRVDLSLHFFNQTLLEWENVLEPCSFSIEVEQLPNEVILGISAAQKMSLDITSALLADLAEVDYKLYPNKSNDEISVKLGDAGTISPQTHTNCIEKPLLFNDSGLDLILQPLPNEDIVEFDHEDPDNYRLEDGQQVSLGTCIPNLEDCTMISVTVCPTSKTLTGSRQTISYLPLFHNGVNLISRHRLECRKGQASAEVDYKYAMEPVMEWCIQNQRLKSAYSDEAYLRKGEDLLSATVWPIDKHSSTRDVDSCWLKPYLDDDVNEWTDMTGCFIMSRDRVMLPDNNWVWANDWKVDISGNYCEHVDADGWEYATSFEAFNTRRFYQKGDKCRRRRWTRTRLIKPPKLGDPQQPLSLVWEHVVDKNDDTLIRIRSHLIIYNFTGSDLSFFAYSGSWKEEEYVGDASNDATCSVPIHLSSATYLRLAKRKGSFRKGRKHRISNYHCSERLMVLANGQTSSTVLRTSIKNASEDESSDEEETDEQKLNFLIEVVTTDGMTKILVRPICKIVNLLPCHLFFRLYNKMKFPNDEEEVENDSIEIGQEKCSLSLNPFSRSLISFRVPGFKWSRRQLIVNRKMSPATWKPKEDKDQIEQSSTDSACEQSGFEAKLQFENLGQSGDNLSLIMEIDFGHCPTIKIFAQFWILDKSGFGLRFSDGDEDMLGTTLIPESQRRSYWLDREYASASRKETRYPGHQWSIGMNGMSLFYSKSEKMAVCVESESRISFVNGIKNMLSLWSSLFDVSTSIPKTVFSLDEASGTRRFELCFNVAPAPSIFSRTKIISLFPRYRIINLIDKPLTISHDECPGSRIHLEGNCSIPFHLQDGSKEPNVRLSIDSNKPDCDRSWTCGSIHLNKIGITSMRLPDGNETYNVVQAEVRLATKDKNSAVDIILSNSSHQARPLYLLRNRSSSRICCCQVLSDDLEGGDTLFNLHSCNGTNNTDLMKRLDKTNSERFQHQCGQGFNCGFMGENAVSDTVNGFIWDLSSRDVTSFGFDDPDKPHILEWRCREMHGARENNVSYINIDAIGSSSVLTLQGGQKVMCQVVAENSTKVIEFTDMNSVSMGDLDVLGLKRKISHYQNVAPIETKATEETKDDEDDEHPIVKVRIETPGLTVSVIDNREEDTPGREILFIQFDNFIMELSQNREGYHELELRLLSLQIDNHLQQAVHPVLVSCPSISDDEPFLHISAVRKLQERGSSLVFRYAAIRVLALDIALDPRTVHALIHCVQPLLRDREAANINRKYWANKVTNEMMKSYSKQEGRFSQTIDPTHYSTQVGRIYFEELHLHPVRISVTFSQAWDASNTVSEMTSGYIRLVPSLTRAPLTFTSFVVSHVFEAPDNLLRIIGMHFFSQLATQFFSVIGSLTIFTGPADFLTNVGSGVRDFFYEPINGLVHGPAQFLEGLETGSLSLARGVFVGVVRGAANVTDTVNANLVGLTDEEFIDERDAYQRSLTDARNRDTSRTIADSMSLAGASIVRGVRSGAVGIVEQPMQNFAKYGAAGLATGIGKALVGAIVKPMVGVGDGAVLVMNHLTDVTTHEGASSQIPKRLRRALPRKIPHKRNSVVLVQYNDYSAKAQITAGGNDESDVYIGHVQLMGSLLIASEQCLWIINEEADTQWNINWGEISHFELSQKGFLEIAIFSEIGIENHMFHAKSTDEFSSFYRIISSLVQMRNSSSKNTIAYHNSNMHGKSKSLKRFVVPGIKVRQEKHIFGRINKHQMALNDNDHDEIDVIEQCFDRVKKMGSESPSFFSSLDEEAWSLIDSWCHLFSGLNSRRCVVAGFINGTEENLQIKSTMLLEGGSPCYQIPSREYDEVQGILSPGAGILFFAWGDAPSLHREGKVFMRIEANAFTCDLLDTSQHTTVAPASGYEVGFLEKSYDQSGWWAKYWLLVTKEIRDENSL